MLDNSNSASLPSARAWGRGCRSRPSSIRSSALIALLTAAIAVLSDYNTVRNTELTRAIETASLAALNVERVNSLVYAVVMEFRGVYMSSEPADVKKYGDGPAQVQRQNPCRGEQLAIDRPGR